MMRSASRKSFFAIFFAKFTTATLSFGSVRSTDAGDYTVVVTNALGSVTSAKATLTVSAAPVTPPPTPAPPSGGGGAINEWFILGLIILASVKGVVSRRVLP